MTTSQQQYRQYVGLIAASIGIRHTQDHQAVSVVYVPSAHAEVCFCVGVHRQTVFVLNCCDYCCYCCGIAEDFSCMTNFLLTAAETISAVQHSKVSQLQGLFCMSSQ